MSAQTSKNPTSKAIASPVPVRLYDGATSSKVPPVVLYLRGRAFLDRDRGEAERPIACAMAEMGAVVLEADYGTISHNVFPQAMECAFQALTDIAGRRKEFGASVKSPLFVAGDEAGGNVAAGVALKARDLLPGELKGQMLFSPMVDPQMATPSFRAADSLGMREAWSDGWSHYIGSFLQHPYAAPCLCSRLFNVAPALIITSQDDPLHDEVLDYAARLKTCQVAVTQHVFAIDCGWTSIYKQGTGRWVPSFQAEIAQFMKNASRAV
ncbi:alpha/beta hydrolase [Tianweitania sp. BSSL-BM11]|uniref:Alpha/beta hydrolase n=1 Tax=Tianweitania aestuarii TaxID=2814886 RepID=A0ABS5RYJ3_9HYPH|nr:alpha/beta hydrolase [Tianweitania aestuarii]MBS9722121.1 alpha/beta hydrolase [Tianweitania aestuarii]